MAEGEDANGGGFQGCRFQGRRARQEAARRAAASLELDAFPRRGLRATADLGLQPTSGSSAETSSKRRSRLFGPRTFMAAPAVAFLGFDERLRAAARKAARRDRHGGHGGSP